jgi:cytidylate kinase
VKRRRPIVAIDGPGGAGKSTVARQLARELSFAYLNTGAMYRAVALAAREAGIKPDDPKLEEKISSLLKSIQIDFEGDRVMLNGRDVSAQITGPEISDLSSTYSTLPIVREKMRELQRAAGENGGVVMEGRDIGTVVFPDAEFKFYLDADPKVRAERRFAELNAKGATPQRDEVLQQLNERDRRDIDREHAPLKRADDAIVIDTTKLSIDEVVRALKDRMQEPTRANRA